MCNTLESQNAALNADPKFFLPRPMNQWPTSCGDYQTKTNRIQTNKIDRKGSATVNTLEDIQENKTLSTLPQPGGYQNIVTMVGVFPRYIFPNSTQDVTAKTVVRCSMHHRYHDDTRVSANTDFIGQRNTIYQK